MLDRLEALVVRGVDLAWLCGFSTVAVRAMWQTEARSAALQIAEMMTPIERRARLGWLTDASVCEAHIAITIDPVAGTRLRERLEAAAAVLPPTIAAIAGN